MNKTLLYFKITMAVVYTAIGVYIILNAKIIRGLVDEQYAPIIGAIVMSYGLFRGYNIWKIERDKE